MAIRLMFEVYGDRVRLVRRHNVEMEAPASPTPQRAGSSGLFAEMRDSDERTLYQADLSPQVTRGVEVYSPDGTIERRSVDEAPRLVMIVAPDLPDASSLVVVRRRGVDHQRGEPQMESLAVDEDELMRVDLATSNESP